MALVALGLLLLPGALSVGLQLQVAIVRYEMREQMEQRELIQLRIDPNAIQWIEYGRELRIGQEMFDVHRLSECPDGSIIVYGLFDAEEQRLKEKIANTTRDTNDTEYQHCAAWLLALFEADNEQPSFLQQAFHSTQQVPTLVAALPAIAYEVQLPPPDHSLVA